MALGLALALLIGGPALADGPTAQVNLKANVVVPCRVITLPACGIDYTSATLWGSLLCCNPPVPVDVSFGWDTVSHKNDPAGYAHWTPAKKLFLGLLFQAGISGLTPGTTYYFRARGQVGGYTAYGEELWFCTPPELQAFTLCAKDITSSGATLNGLTWGRSMSTKAKVSFGWDTTSHDSNPAGYPSWTPSQNVAVGDYFSAKLSNLKPDTVYYYRVRAERNGIVSYGDQLSFRTLPDFQVVTLAAKNIASDTATLCGKTSSQMSSPKIKVSFGLDTVSHAANPSDYAGWTSTQNVNPGDTFSVKLTRLKPNTTYYFRARGVRNGTVCYGEELSFKTSAGKTSWNLWDWICSW